MNEIPRPQAAQITGHEGFIGSRLVQILGEKAFPFSEKEAPKNVLIHLAGRVGVKANQDRSLTDVFDEMRMHERVFEYARVNTLPFFLASSSEVYGSSVTPMQETDRLHLDSPGEKRWVYARIKMLNEQLGAMLHAESGRKVIVGRFFNVCGPGQLPESGMVMARLVYAALRNEPLVVYGSGKQVRTFTHIDDACTAIIQLVSNPDNDFSIVNIGTENTLSVEELAGRIISITGSTSEIRKVESGLPEIFQRIPDITKLKTMIPGWDPHPIDRIILDTATWMDKVYTERAAVI